MELEFGGVYEQLNCDRYIDVDGGLDLWYFYTYPEILWDHLSNNISNNEGSDLRSLCFHNDVCQKVSALEESLLLSQIWKSQWEGEQLEAQELQQDYSKGNRGTNSRVSVSLLNTTECSSSESSRLGSRPNPKPKPKVCWTPELHWLFLKAVEEVGLHNAVPTKILRLMGVSCLTRHHVASHLQKYRSAIKLGKPTKDVCMRRSNKKRSRNCEKIFNEPGLAGDSWLMQPSTDKVIHPAKASGTAHYEEGEALQDSAQPFQGLAEDKGGSVSFVDLQAHINSATMCHPARYVE